MQQLRAPRPLPIAGQPAKLQHISSIVEAQGEGSGALSGFLGRMNRSSTQAAGDDWDDWGDGGSHADSDSDPGPSN